MLADEPDDGRRREAGHGAEAATGEVHEDPRDRDVDRSDLGGELGQVLAARLVREDGELQVGADGARIRGRRVEGRNFGFAALAAVVAGFWSLMSGTVVVMALKAIGHLVA